MNNKPSHYKVITFIVFLCVAIMTSVFVFHSKQKTVSLANNNVSIFPVAREVKSFSLLTRNNQAFTQKNLYNHLTLLFFGFTHCSDICPNTLEMLNRTYKKLQNRYPSLQIVLISIDPERDTAETVSQYANSFNSAFIGVTGKMAELRKLQGQFGIYSARSDEHTNYQIQHTSSIMLINAKGQWAGLFKYGMSPEQFAREFERVAREIS